MRKYAFILFAVSLTTPSLWGQTYTFPTINNDTAVHQFTEPIPCPSTNAPDCAGANNAALNGKNSVWAECDFDNSGGIANPECSGSTQQVVASSASAAVTNNNYVHIVRATDASVFGNGPFSAGGDGGQMGENGIDATSTRMVFQSGASFIVFSFDPDPTSPTYLQVHRLYGSNSIVAYQSYFSRQPPPYAGGRTVSYWYTFLLGSAVPGGGSLTASHVYLTQWDFSSTTTFPTLGSGITAYDMSVSSCLGNIDTSAWTRVVANSLQVSYDDNYFNAAFENHGVTCLSGLSSSNCRDLIIVYDKPNNKCVKYRTDLGQVTNEAGITTNIVEQNSGRNFVEDTTGDGSPNFFVGGLMYTEAVPGTCTPTNSPNPCPLGYGSPRHVWETGIPYPGNMSPTGNKAWAISSTGKCCSHRAAGFSHFLAYTDPGVGYYQPQWVFNTTASTQTALDASNTIGFNNCYNYNSNTTRLCLQDDHKSWSLNTDGTDSAPFLDNVYVDSMTGVPNFAGPGSHTPVNVPWNMEEDLWPTSCYPNGCGPGIKPWRVVHTFIDGVTGQTNGNYSETVGTAAVSSHPVHGNIFITWTSNWQGQLGCQNGTYDTTGGHGLGCPGQADRYDVFIAVVPVTSPQTYYFFWHI